ncbi:GNAT family N-acetyltransferase [Paenibacillus faecalis]|uniref:GNAT family N-acetyltransferase n=1 Tax=Paenibacillus faecalis TaxID=2079532 RepID=UPI000D112D7E|nr:GNAT family N-acetyltransferase [Paenibacillus faecalis]
MNLRFTYLNRNHLNLLEEWHKDEETEIRIGIDDLEEWFSFVNSSADYLVWIISDGDEQVGELSVEMTDYKTASISYVINPIRRNRGYGKAILKQMPHLKALLHIEVFEAWVDDDNVPSLICLERTGFVRACEEADEDGLYHYILTRSDK